MIQTACVHLVHSRPVGVHRLLRPVKDADSQKWAQVMQNIGELALPVLESFVEQAQRLARRGQRRAISESLTGFKDWITQQTSVGTLHRSMKRNQLPPMELLQDSTAVIHPKDTLDCKSKKWQQVWAPHNLRTRQIVSAFEAAREAAQQDTMPPITAEGVRSAAHRIKAYTALGG
ncbi:unnamed protein product [Prorocentrum cordatum]|uniref:Uncharacterized protein n=1 Tax=Prorocentrum cordatum TaxID=2364126 RepID=A0ABN9WW74_9DINO|nr:unnamed protein product [Polarella glacialis]